MSNPQEPGKEEWFDHFFQGFSELAENFRDDFKTIVVGGYIDFESGDINTRSMLINMDSPNDAMAMLINLMMQFPEPIVFKVIEGYFKMKDRYDGERYFANIGTTAKAPPEYSEDLIKKLRDERGKRIDNLIEKEG